MFMYCVIYSIILTGIGLFAVRSSLVCKEFICMNFNHLASWACIISVFALSAFLKVDRRCPIFDFYICSIYSFSF
jgi:hypothetical protein